MNQSERLLYLLQELLREGGNESVDIPTDQEQQKMLLRGLMNVRKPEPLSPEILRIQDEYLQEGLKTRTLTYLENLTPVEGEQIYLWQGDITTLVVDGIVNAANEKLLGCFVPGHHCIDNTIHTFAGMQLRLACHSVMKTQGHPEPTGQAKITPAFNLPSKYILHTVGPIIYGSVTEKDKQLLSSCYQSCLELAQKRKLKSIAFSCISTGEFSFPQDLAAEIAVFTVRKYLQETKSRIKVVFNVFTDLDKTIYTRLL